MFNNNFYFTFFTLIAFSAVFTYSGYTHDGYPPDFSLPGSTYADVEGNIAANPPGNAVGKDIHIHGIVYSWNDVDKKDHAVGDYTLALQVSAPENEFGWDDNWWEERFNALTPVLHQDDFEEGCRIEDKISFYAPNLSDVRAVECQASATVRNRVGNARDHIKKPVDEFNWDEGLGPTYSEHVDSSVTSPTSGIFVSGSNQTYQPGDSATLNLVTSEPYYSVDWYVHAPWDTSSSGTYQQNVSGDGTSTETSFSYTFPSGTMYTGNFTFRAVIYRWSDMSQEGDETYTITVE